MASGCCGFVNAARNQTFSRHLRSRKGISCSAHETRLACGWCPFRSLCIRRSPWGPCAHCDIRVSAVCTELHKFAREVITHTLALYGSLLCSGASHRHIFAGLQIVSIHIANNNMALKRIQKELLDLSKSCVELEKPGNDPHDIIHECTS